jgi:pilus assembly protein Flp/PilA
MTKFFKSLWQDEDGATAIEYGLLAALIAVAIIITVTALGGELNETFAGVETDLNAANAGTPPAAD